MITATPQSVREGSGTYVAFAALARALEDAGHEVRLEHPVRETGPFGYTVHRFWFNRSLRPSAFAEADVVVGWDMDGYRLAGRLPQTFITYIHGQLAEEAAFERGLVAASMRMQARAEWRAARRANRVITVSARSRGRVAELYDVPLERIAIVPPPFDAKRWCAALDTVEPQTSEERPRVLSVARMYARKNLLSLVRATAILRQQMPDVHVTIVGDGPERWRLAGLVDSLGLEGSVQLPGQVSFQELVDAYKRCDVFCLPSLQEGFGLVFLEAMASGVPVVACRGTAADELVDDGVNGLLVEQRDDAALTEALLVLLKDGARRRSMGEAGRTRVAQYHPTIIAERFVTAISFTSFDENTRPST